MDPPLKILLLEDSEADADLLARELKQAKMVFTLVCVQTKVTFVNALDKYTPDIILSDYSLPDFDGFSALNITRKIRPNVPFIFVSGTMGEERAVESLKHGASDYLVKGNLQRLPSSIARSIEEKRLRSERERMEEQLRASEDRFKSIAEQSPIGIMMTDIEGREIFCNEYWGHIVDRPLDYAMTVDRTIIFHPEDREAGINVIKKILADQQPVNINYRIVRPSGEIRWVENRLSCLHNRHGIPSGFISLLVDNTENQLAENKIVRLSRIHAMLSSINSTIVRVNDLDQLLNDVCHTIVSKGSFRFVSVCLVDPDTKLITANVMKFHDLNIELPVGFPWLGKPINSTPNGEAVFLSRKHLIINNIDTAPGQTERIEWLSKLGIASMLYLPLMLGDKISGVITLTANTADFFTGDEVRLLTELSEDIAFALDHLEKEAKLNYLAYYDALTGLPNRTLFIDHLKQQVENAQTNNQQMALVFFDVDKFRHINQSFGEDSGDDLLRTIANRLKTNATSATSLGRIGGDVFGAIVPVVSDVASLIQLFERQLYEWAATPFTLRNEEVSISFKAGLALFPEDGNDAEMVFQNANAALKQAKQSGQQLLRYEKNINERVSEKIKMEARLHRALEQQQFLLFYQPKVNLTTLEVSNVEALIRWNDPERGLILPGEFIPLLEETGLICEVGLWALQRAFGDHELLRMRFGVAPRIAVNVSALQLQRTTFSDEVLSVIGEAAEGTHGIDIEITESLIMYDIENNIRKLRELRNHNVHIAVDDFGTGYSSLSYIAKLPIDVLKIDRSFVMRMSDSAEDLAIVSSIITLAHSLNLKVVAEGVETQTQARILTQLGCDEAQGFLYARPMPITDLIALMSNQDALKPARGLIKIKSRKTKPVSKPTRAA